MTGTATPTFGGVFADQVVQASCLDGVWSAATIGSLTEATTAPTALALHYGQTVFEGLKAFGRPGGGVGLFRVRDCAQRLQRSAERMAMQAPPQELFVQACLDAVRRNRELVPMDDAGALYLRPMVFASEQTLAVRPSAAYRFLVLAAPVGSFVTAGRAMIDIYCEPGQWRAAPGGTSAAKCGGNYAAAMGARSRAASLGFDEVLWVDQREARWLEEFGAMNCFAVRDLPGGPVLVTPPLSDTILAGHTRDTVMRLAAAAGIEVRCEPIALDDVLAADGDITELFATGTAAGVAPVGSLTTDTGRRRVLGDGPGPVSSALAHQYRQIVTGRRVLDPDWLDVV